MQVFSGTVQIGTVSTFILGLIPSRLHSVIVEADCVNSIDVGAPGIISDDGLKMPDGATLSFSWQDFNPADPTYGDLVLFHAVGHDAGDKVRVFGMRR